MTAGDLITAPFQIEWRGVLWGWPATAVGVTNLSGWLDLPNMRGQNSDRSGRHGSFPGQKFAGDRTIEVELTVIDDDTLALAAIRAATSLTEDPTEETFVAWFGTDAPQQVAARLERRAVPTDREWSIGHHRATLQFVATEPRRYALTASTGGPIGLPAAGVGGLPFPIVFPLTFGSGPVGGSLTVTNTGDAATWPTFTVTGPVTGPVITNVNTGQQLGFDPLFTVAAGQTMTVDTDTRSILVSGVSRSDRLYVRRWFPLPPGPTTVSFTSVGVYDPAAQFTVTFRSAYL